MSFQTFTVAEAAKKLGKTESELIALIESGDLNAFKIGNSYKILGDDIAKLEQQGMSAGSETIDEPEAPVDNSQNKPYIICGQDPVLDLIWEQLASKPYDRPLGRSYICSYQSLNALYFGEVMAGAAHLIDISDSLENYEYNKRYARYLVPGSDCALIHLTCRSQGFFVKEGNPKGITGWKDLARPDVRFMNRELGAGVRVLIDEMLRYNGVLPSQVQGYEDIAQSHIAAASAVGRGDCDVSLGAQRVTRQVNGIEFIEMKRERYELVVRKESLEDPQMKDIIQLLQNGEIKEKIAKIEGYYPDDMGLVTYITASTGRE